MNLASRMTRTQWISRLVLAGACFTSSVGCDTWSSRLPAPPMSPERLRTADTLTLTPSTLPATAASTTRPLPTTRPAQVSLRLDEARALALRHNLNLSAALIDPAIASAAISAEEALFDAVFTTRADYGTFDQPTASRLEGSQSESLNVTPGLRIPLITGGTIGVEVPLSRSSTNNEFSQLNPAYESDLTLSIRQPLARGFGPAVTERGIRLAFYSQQQAELNTKLQAIRTIADVDRAYWRLQAARRELDVRLSNLDLANAQLERARRQVRAQQVPEVEIIRAESGAADQLELVISAENQLRQRQRELKRLMNSPDLGVGSQTVIIPESIATTLSFDLDADSLVDKAIAERTELLNAELDIIRRTIDIAAARNDLLPLVTLDYTYNINGLGPALDESLTLARDADYQDHRVGLQVEIPIGNRAARARHRQAILQRLRALADRTTQALQVRQEVLDAVDNIRTNYQRVLAARQRVVLNRRLVEAEVRQFTNGLRTSTEVLDAQTKLADAESSLVSAEAEYQISQIDLAFATGTTLGSAKVAWTPIDNPNPLVDDKRP
jgi:outer membrane protein